MTNIPLKGSERAAMHGARSLAPADPTVDRRIADRAVAIGIGQRPGDRELGVDRDADFGPPVRCAVVHGIGPCPSGQQRPSGPAITEVCPYQNCGEPRRRGDGRPRSGVQPR